MKKLILLIYTMYNYYITYGIENIPLIIVDKMTKVIIDGHHRYHLYKLLRLHEIIVLYIENYIVNTNIIVNSQTNITKRDVIQMGLSDCCFSYKTTHHLILIDDVYYPISKLYDMHMKSN